MRPDLDDCHRPQSPAPQGTDMHGWATAPLDGLAGIFSSGCLNEAASRQLERHDQNQTTFCFRPFLGSPLSGTTFEPALRLRPIVLANSDRRAA